MRRLLTILCLSVLTLGIAVPSFAALISVEVVSGEPLVYDDVNNLYWIADLTLLSNQNFTDQENTITNFNATMYGGTEDWHFANNTEYSYLRNSIKVEHNDIRVFTPTETSTSDSYYEGRVGSNNSGSSGTHDILYFPDYGNDGLVTSDIFSTNYADSNAGVYSA